MKKSIAKIVSVLLVVLMAISMIPAVSAAVTIDSTTKRTITVTNQYAAEVSEGEGNINSDDLQFTAYKVATFEQVGNKLVYTMTSNTTSTGINAESKATDVTLSASATGTVLTQSDDSFVLDAGTENAIYYIKCTAKPTNVKQMESVLVQVPNMYDEADGTKATEWKYSFECAPKAKFQSTGSSKDIVLADGTLVDSTTATGAKGERVGDDITFQLEATVLGTTADPMTLFALRDTMSAGLTYNNDVVVYGVKADNSETDITANFNITPGVAADGKSTAIDFAAKADFLKADLYDYVTVKVVYTAEVNENAVMGSTGNPNTVYLEYDNDGDDVHDRTPDDTVVVYTYGVQIYKLDSDGKTPLQGAEFEIADATGKVLDKGVTGEDGKLNFARLAPGTYTVTETKAPAGYQLLADSITVTVTADNATTDGMYQVTVTNSKFDTPVTGGIGSTIFVVSGLAIIALGGTLLFVASRKRESK